MVVTLPLVSGASVVAVDSMPVVTVAVASVVAVSVGPEASGPVALAASVLVASAGLEALVVLVRS